MRAEKKMDTTPTSPIIIPVLINILIQVGAVIIIIVLYDAAIRH